MKTTLKLEELLMFVLGILAFNQLNFAWWWFLVLILTPDIGMLGYLVNSKVGAFFYNIFHHKALAIIIYLIGMFYENEKIQLIGIILFSHASFDRIFGYGLKYNSSFQDTHLGKIGNK
ncbi:uncharacterized protein DUF4260 [Mariniflexile fucanivorans]|uniref:Uncharacterized protein DUF4260 n=1 Tax=Mariniflexile fucanivorans TaxID=264023 RepID=A0A4R1RQP0_9FLAO|nr:DUF4260 domain-containing protein [Mariniflexile fucanivorans]TCL68731.1 uncharacterized protein DUF4260 [Mariniflexile fucanivorans]